MRITTFCWAIVVAFTFVAESCFALEPAEIENQLKGEIIGSELPMIEVKAFCESRVPRMPDLSSRKEWDSYSDKLRQDMLERVVYRGEAAKWRDVETKVEWLKTIEGGEGYRIKTLRFEALPGLWIPALLYEPTELKGKVPVVMNVNGHDRKDGKAAKYKQIRCINQAKRGMIALNVEWIGMGQLQGPDYTHYAMNQLDLCGTSGLAPFYLAMKRGLDVLLAHENADPKRVAVAGLSGGGWQTIFISALDTRVTLCNPVAGYSSFITRVHHQKDLGDSEQTPCDMATVGDYTHMTALLAPRAALLTYNQNDTCCFEAPYALPPLIKAAEPVYKLYDVPERLRSHVNEVPGNHNFEEDNREALYRMLRNHFYDSSDAFDPKEIACDDELKSFEDLTIPLPEGNATFNTLALELAKPLPRDGELPSDKSKADEWQRDRRVKLASLVKYHRLDCVAAEHTSTDLDGVTIKHWRLRIGDMWTMPTVDFDPTNAKQTAIVVNDEGRAASSAIIAKLLADRTRVLAIDPFYFGESQIAQRDFLYALLVSAVGERPLGIQASQLAATARWLRSCDGTTPVSLVANGPRSSAFAMVAAAIESNAIASVEVTGSLSSWRQLIENKHTVNQFPELFCFGLLREFDLLQVAALVAPRQVTFYEAGYRLQEDLKSLAHWYQTFEVKHKLFH